MSCPCGCASAGKCLCGTSWKEPKPKRQCGCGRCGSGPLMPLLRFAELRGLIYRKRLGPGLAPQTFVHFFDRTRPLLLRSLGGRRLYIVGGRFRITRRGIVG